MPREQTPADARSVATEIAERVAALPGSPARRLIAIAGPPASGKSTVSAMLCAELNLRKIEAGLVAMDGFHLDNAILDARGLRSRKGAPETFDLAGFVSLLERLSHGGEVIAPTFDREKDLSLGSSAVITPEMRTVVVEGNYLLLDEADWRNLASLWNLSVFLEVSRDELKRRLVDRWIGYGFAPDVAQAKALGNDLPNAERILDQRLPSDMVISG